MDRDKHVEREKEREREREKRFHEGKDEEKCRRCREKEKSYQWNSIR